mgnify:CR=1 FL=1
MIIEIKKREFSAKIDSFGAQLISFSDGETEYIWQREKPYWQKCAPILFPVVGRSFEGIIEVDGDSYSMPIHGFASGKEFSVVKQSENEVLMLLEDDDKTLKCYPFKFNLFVNFTIDNEGIKTEIKVVNTDDKEIFFGIGGHPGICSPLFNGDEFEDYHLEFDKDYVLKAITCDENAVILPESEYEINLTDKKLPLKRELFIPDAIIIEDAPFKSLKFLNGENKGIEFDFSNFKSFAIWTEALPAKAPFICFEPWNSMGKRKGETASIKDKFGILNLESGKEFVCSYSINPIK